MKKIVTAVVAIILSVLATQETMAQRMKIVPKVYAFGFSASFNDSVVYISDIQEIDSVWVTTRNNFLVNRYSYSNQLRDFLAEKRHDADRTCIISFAFKKKDIEKKYIKLKQRYTKNGDFEVKTLTNADFLFKRVDFNPTDEDMAIDEPTKKSKKKEKRNKKGEKAK